MDPRTADAVGTVLAGALVGLFAALMFMIAWGWPVVLLRFVASVTVAVVATVGFVLAVREGLRS